LSKGSKLANSSVENNLLVQANSINEGNIEMLGLGVSLLVSVSRACSSSNVQRHRASDGPTFHVCNSDEFGG